ncbi:MULTISPECIES: cyclic lactone autoinducer peptide [unclassified Paenibacillus]|uniref:cyclic lactone autoinducer peptide n=1 Tax=unclassified Paenibacillus TaxID=185978 RepID=UPI002405A01A|nr:MULTISPECIES: cyclic lactone autoinducer peptide [unclassified Paenibacillus]MDF9843915.1 cyclic lactone autoinducer peptide [Paenibacillus sp. PastF-2]MDF9850520.1 cyclic lactone autoinducer peptide [Paenibacillus sp. PastM-2]MDF9856246.1 cyclic lactone autoinducer peptide [Paenibacillus sp. PastF-1]MDH6481525.1 cyclic lactone autoinducer peptide [Paenibacillus sp. PastH-2]MDH6509839.1 cyclic lactone autoinducer peptide [Paenibacillus sp. PastM-3]
MKTMTQRMFNEVKEGMSKTVRSAAIKSGDIAMETCCSLLFHEPKIPMELLKASANR